MKVTEVGKKESKRVPLGNVEPGEAFLFGNEVSLRLTDAPHEKLMVGRIANLETGEVTRTEFDLEVTIVETEIRYSKVRTGGPEELPKESLDALRLTACKRALAELHAMLDDDAPVIKMLEKAVKD